MRPELRDKIIKYNRERAAYKEASDDLCKLLNKIPRGILKQIARDAELAAVLKKYGVELDQ